MTSTVAWARDDADAAARAFFNAVRDKKYPVAYRFFARGIQQQVSYDQFVDGAERIKGFRILQQDVQDREANLVKFTVRASLRLLYQGRLYDAVYVGQADVYREQGQWKVLSVHLVPKSQKAVPDTNFRYDSHPSKE